MMPAAAVADLAEHQQGSSRETGSLCIKRLRKGLSGLGLGRGWREDRGAQLARRLEKLRLLAGAISSGLDDPAR